MILYLIGLVLSPILLAVAWIALRLSYRAAIYWITYRKYAHIPKLPKAFSLLDLMSLDGGLTKWLEYTHDSKTGAVPKVSDHGFSMTADGSHYLMFNTAEAAKQILTDTQLFPKLPLTYNLTEPLLGKGLVTSEGKIWKDHRRLLTPLFHFNNLKNNIPVINTYIRKDLDKIQQGIAASKTGVHELDTEHFFKHLTMSVIIAVAFGNEFNNDWMAQKWNALMLEMNNVFVQDMLLGPIYKYLPLGTGRFWKLRQEVVNEVKKAIANRRANPVSDDKAVDLMSAMMHITDEETALTDQNIVDQCLTFLFAGHDTTASTLSWVLYFLAKQPEELKKARAEVDRVLGPRSASEEISISADKIHELEYCKAILFETMRLRTPVVGVDRYPTRDTEIDGVKVFAGQNTAVGIGFFNIHRNPLYWPQPEKFIPDRFVTGSAHHDPKRHPFAFIPFSAGERNCIGMKLAQNEAFLAIAHIVRRFDFSVNDEKMIPASAPLYVPKNLVWQVRERQD